MSDPRYRIVVALDLSEYADIVLQHALDQAARQDAPDLHFLVVQEQRDAAIEGLKARLAALVYQGLATFRGDRPDWRARLHVRTGSADEEIVGLAGEVDAHLLVLGRFGVHHTSRRHGSVTARVVEASPCPVLVVGLTDHVAPAPETCADCAQVREDSDGERWFCAAHSAPDRVGLATTLLPMSMDWSGGGLMW